MTIKIEVSQDRADTARNEAVDQLLAIASARDHERLFSGGSDSIEREQSMPSTAANASRNKKQ